MEQLERTYFSWAYKMVWPFWRTIWQFLMELDIYFAYNTSISLLYTYPKEMKTYVHIKSYSPVFIEALSRIVPNWKQPQFSFSQWIENKLWYTHTVVIKKDELLIYTPTWINLTNIMLNKRGQIQKIIYYMISLIWNSRKDKTIVVSGHQGPGYGALELTVEGFQELSQVMAICCLIIVVVITWLSSKPSFVNLGATDILGNVVFCCQGLFCAFLHV